MTNVDLDKLRDEITTPPEPDAAVQRFAPRQYRAPTSLAQWTNDMRKRLNDIKQLCDDALRDLG